MRLLATALLAAIVATPAIARDKLVSVPSNYPVKETVDRLVKALEEKGLKAALRVDHAAAAKASGLELKPTEVVFFGNPKLGTPLMQASRSAAIDLPMKVVAWEDDKGKTWVSYVPTRILKSRHGIKGQDEVLKTMDGALAAFAKAASQ
jgi:uncharacterized protein (DUF302 family)